VVLGWFKRQDGISVAQSDETDFFAGKEFLDDQPTASGTNQIAGKYIMKYRKSGDAIRANHDAFASREPICF
jgi:hypothetical protein